MKKTNSFIFLAIVVWLAVFLAAMTRMYPGFWNQTYDYYVEARFHEDHGRLAEAIAVMEKALRASPDDPGYLVVKGYLHQKAGQNALAEDAFRQALERDPNNVEARYGLIAEYRRRGLREEMYRELCLVTVPKADAEGLRRRGQVLSELGLSQKALDDQCLALDKLPENPGLLWEAASSASAAQDWTRAESLYARLERRAMESDNHVLARQAVMGRAAALRAMGRPSEAAELYARAPGDDTLRPRAELALQLERFDEASQIYGQLVALEPADRAAQGSWAYALERSGHAAEAEETYRKMQAGGPLEGDDAVRYAWLLNRRRQHAEALQVLDAAPAKTPEIVAVRIQTASWLASAKAGAGAAPAVMDEEARLQARLRADPDDADARTALAGLYANTGRISQAEAEYKAALARRQGHPPALIGLAELYERHNRSAEAIPLYAAAADKGGASPELAFRLGRVMSWNGRHAEAVPWHRRAAEGLPPGKQRGEARLNLGLALLESRQPAEALKVLRPLAEEKPTDPAVLLAAARAASDSGDMAQSAAYLDRLARVRKLTPAERTWLADMRGGLVKPGGRAGTGPAENLTAQEALGDQRLNIGDGKGALEAYGQVPAAERSRRYHLKAARAAQVAGDLELARASFAQALAADPANAELALEAARFHLTVHDHDRALALYRQVLEARGGRADPAFARELAGANIAAQRFAEAETWARQALAADPADWKAALLTAQSLHLQGKTEAADEMLQKHRPALENNPEAVELMGMVAMARDRHLEAFNHFDRLTRMDGASKKKAWLWRGNAARARGDFARADESYAMAAKARN